MPRNLGGTFQYAAWRIASATIRRTPPRVGYTVARVIGTIGYHAWPRGRRAMLNNYLRVLPEATKQQRAAVAKQSLVNYCRYLADFIRLPSIPAERIIQDVQGDPFEPLDRILERGKGVVIVCMHFGNWDLGAGATAARGYPLSVVTETFADPRLDDMVCSARTRLGMKILKMEKAGPSLYRCLKQNGLLALLIDRAMPGDGVRVSFFGEEVEVPAGPARLALKTGATVIPTAFARISPSAPAVRALCDFELETRSTGDSEADIQALTQLIMNSHERFIRQFPEQWYMFRPMWAERRRASTA